MLTAARFLDSTRPLATLTRVIQLIALVSLVATLALTILQLG